MYVDECGVEEFLYREFADLNFRAITFYRYLREKCKKTPPKKRNTQADKRPAESLKHTRALAISLGYEPVVPPQKTGKSLVIMMRNSTKKRNEAERFFRHYRRFRRICTRYDKLDVMFLAFFIFALIFR